MVLLGMKPFPTPAVPMSFQIGRAGRPQFNLATVIARHPLFDEFPHDGYCDFQFAKMMEGGAAVEFDSMPRGLRSNSGGGQFIQAYTQTSGRLRVARR